MSEIFDLRPPFKKLKVLIVDTDKAKFQSDVNFKLASGWEIYPDSFRMEAGYNVVAFGIILHKDEH